MLAPAKRLRYFRYSLLNKEYYTANMPQTKEGIYKK